MTSEEERLLVIFDCWEEHDRPSDDEELGHLFNHTNTVLKSQHHQPIKLKEWEATLLKAIDVGKKLQAAEG
jgi:hypothetical protein